MVLRGTYDTIKQVFQDLIAPQLQEIKGEIVAVRGEMNGIRGEMDGLRGQIDGMRGQIDGMRGQIDGLRGEMRQVEKRMEEGFAAVRNEIALTHKRIDDFLEVRERLAALEARSPERS